MTSELFPRRRLAGWTLAAFVVGVVVAAPTPSWAADPIQSEAEALVRQMAEANRYWLVAPPDAVRQFQYDYDLGDKPTRSVVVSDPASASRPEKQGMTYWTPLHALANEPAGVTYTRLERRGSQIEIDFDFGHACGFAIGNGLSGSWYGYGSAGAQAGTVAIESSRMVPVSCKAGPLEQHFEQYTAIDPGHFAPLRLRVRKEDMHFDWSFRVYAPGLWLLDEARYGVGEDPELRVVASTANVVVNQQTPQLVAQAREAAEAKQRRDAGREAVRNVLEANRLWLWPSLEARRGLAYEYQQEDDYTERILFDDAGNVFARLMRSRETSEPTRQFLFTADGFKATGDVSDPPLALYGDPLVSLSRLFESPDETGENLLRADRMTYSLAIGLAWECAATRLAREPDEFRAEVTDRADATYTLTLWPRGGAQIFTGTMLAFTSWAYMHDVQYERADLTIEAATHRILREEDFGGDGKVVASYTFSNWLPDPAGAAPARIDAVVLYEKDDRDQSLEMQAEFRIARPGVWLLDTVHSTFRNDAGQSTGKLTVLPTANEIFQPVTDTLRRMTATRDLLQRITSAPERHAAVSFVPGQPMDLAVRAVWAEESVQQRKDREADGDIAVVDARLDAGPRQSDLLLTLASTLHWKEALVRVRVRVLDGQGELLADDEREITVRAEAAPGLAEMLFSLGDLLQREGFTGKPLRLEVDATIERLTGAYHGHGLWMYFTSGDAEAQHGSLSAEGGDRETAEVTPEQATWLRALKSDNDSDREMAARKLGDCRNTSVVPALIAALSDPEWDVRTDVADALGKLGDVRAVEALAQATRDPHAGVRANAVAALGEFGRQTNLPALVAALADDDERVRTVAAHVLLERGWQPSTRAERVRLLIASGRLDDAKAVAPVAQPVPECEHTVRGPFARDLPVLVNLTVPAEENKRPEFVVHWIDFTPSDAPTVAKVNTTIISWPKAAWRLELALLGEGDRVLRRTETRIENSGIIAGRPMSGEVTFRLDLGPDPIPEPVRAFTLTVTP
ncbi:MAG: HEAT repeat domain-containing protein [Phycisphaerae bacterium]|nr:HEAT repeat domain-containing protein [Phycisphaerae bacterium]